MSSIFSLPIKMACLTCVLFMAAVANAIPAFPGAEGGGALATGGRGGKVYKVKNLNDAGEGSLRYGINGARGKSEPIIIVFDVSGYIDLRTTLDIEDDANITIAGQTAPEGGITLGLREKIHDPVMEIKNSSNIIIRYLKVRRGGKPFLFPERSATPRANGITIRGNSHDIIIDHSSISWGGLQNISLWHGESDSPDPSNPIDPIKNITLQWSISAEGVNFYDHAVGLLTGSSSKADDMENISIHHSYFAHHNNRNPLLKVKSGDIVSNIIYDWYWLATQTSGGVEADIIGNHYKNGHSCCLPTSRSRNEIAVKPYDSTVGSRTGAYGDPSIYFESNSANRLSYRIPNVINPSTDDIWNEMMEYTDIKGWGYPKSTGKKTPVSIEFKREIPRNSKISTTPSIFDFSVEDKEPVELIDKLFGSAGVGASQRIDQEGNWIYNRDPIDRRVINDYESFDEDSVAYAGGRRIDRVIYDEQYTGTDSVVEYFDLLDSGDTKFTDCGNAETPSRCYEVQNGDSWESLAKDLYGATNANAVDVALDIGDGVKTARDENIDLEDGLIIFYDQFPTSVTLTRWPVIPEIKVTQDQNLSDSGYIFVKDADQDGMPDIWELKHGLDDNDQNDFNEDLDNDGYTNIEEYLNGTNPRLAGENAYLHFALDDSLGQLLKNNSEREIYGEILGSNANTARILDGQINGSFHFNGENDRLVIEKENFNVGASDLTFMAWAKTDDAEQQAGIVSLGSTDDSNPRHRVRMGIDNGKLRYGFYSAVSGWRQGVVGPDLTGDWHHLAVTIERGHTATAYVDGVKVHQFDISALEQESNMLQLYADLYIGYDGWTADKFFDGQLDEVKVFRYALTDNAIKSIYDQDLASNNPDNLALNKTAVASSPNSTSAQLANDGELATQWSSRSADNEWWFVDLGSKSSFNRLAIDWGQNFGKEYDVLISDTSNINDWTSIYSESKGGCGLHNIDLSTATARYVGVLIEKRSSNISGSSIKEFEVVNITGPRQWDNLARQYCDTNTSSNKNSKELAVDGDLDTGWTSNANDGEWFYIDLGSVKEFSKVVIKWGQVYGKDYKILNSQDTTDWTLLYETSNSGREGDGQPEIIDVGLVNSRYIGVLVNSRSSDQSGFTILEFEVY